MELYRNPFLAPEPGSTGDPFVMRYDGSYYLYFSAGAKPSYLYCWKSDNLVDWTHMGIACDLPEICGGYAPEVIYNRGKFYMCTSPHGNGHYLLCSNKPEGPYKRISERIGQRIDGSFFIDDDGKSYFYRAEHSGINYHTMPDPGRIDVPGTPIRESCLGGQWTEGPMVLKHNKKYFLTYTGNHLLSKGYKVSYSVSDDSPVSGYINMKNRTVLIETGDDFHGLGHSSSALAPDMDGAYIIYHTYELVKKPGFRSMNVDRLFFNGSRMYANTIWWDQEKPTLADYSTRGLESLKRGESGDAVRFMTKKRTGDIYTAEININSKGTPFTLLYASGKGRMSVEKGTITVTENSRTVAAKALPCNIEPKSNNAYRFSRGADGTTRLMLNNNQDFLEWKSALKGGKIGVEGINEAKTTLGFIGFSSHADGSSDRAHAKGVPGRMDAVHSITPNVTSAYTENGRDIYCVDAKKGTEFEYKINVKEDGFYDLSLQLRNPKDAIVFTLGDKELTAALPDALDSDGSAIVYLGTLKLEAGIRNIKIVSGCEITVDSFFFTRSAEVEDKALVTDSEPAPDLVIMGLKGPRSLSKKFCGLSLSEGNGYGFIGHEGWKDYRLTAVINGTVGSTGSAELLFRIRKESYFGSQPFSSAYGYSLRINGNDTLTLNEWDYGEKQLASYTLFDKGTFSHEITVIVMRQKIAVIFDGKNIINRDIPMGNISGKVGFRVTEENFGISEMKVEKIR